MSAMTTPPKYPAFWSPFQRACTPSPASSGTVALLSGMLTKTLRITRGLDVPMSSDMFACAAPLAALARSLLPHSLSPMTTATRCWLPSPQGACHPSPGWMEITISCAYCQTGGAEDMLVNSKKRGAKFCDFSQFFFYKRLAVRSFSDLTHVTVSSRTHLHSRELPHVPPPLAAPPALDRPPPPPLPHALASACGRMLDQKVSTKAARRAQRARRSGRTHTELRRRMISPSGRPRSFTASCAHGPCVAPRPPSMPSIHMYTYLYMYVCMYVCTYILRPN